MSIVSAIFSSRRSSSRIDARIAFFMDNLFAIAFGLGLRFVVDSVSNHDFKLTGTLVGLWEGVVTLHFLKKMPKSSDPYIAYLVRLFVDFLVTESVIRLVLVIVWTGMGMVLADIAPAIWHDVGGHRIWRRFRRDMYYMSRSVPTIPPLFPRARVVRFSPVIQPTEISETLSSFSPTAATPTVTSPVPITRIVPPTPPESGLTRTRRVPGGDVSVFSATDSDRGSVIGAHPPPSTRSVGTAHVRYTVRPRRSSVDESASQAPSDSVDASNLSSEASSVSTETPSQAPALQVDVEIPLRSRDKGKGRADDPGTPTHPPFVFPPTPSDSFRPHHFEMSRSSIVPTITGMPSIPDFYEPGLGSDWENIRREEALSPPTPPEKDFDSKSFIESPPVHYIPPPSVYEPTPRPSTFDQDLWDDVSNAAPPTPYTRPTGEQRTSRLPPPTTSTIQAMQPPAPLPFKKRKSEPPPVPQTPVYGDAWDTERDQMPPPTPSVFARTPMYDHTVDLNESVIGPSESIVLVNPVEQEQGPSDPSGTAPEQQGPGDFSFETDYPWNNPTPLVQQHEEQQQQQPTEPTQLPSVPPTPQTKPATPPTPSVPTKAPPTPQQRPGAVPPTPAHPGTVPPTSAQQTQPIPPTPQHPPKSVPGTPQRKPKTVPSTPAQPLEPIPPTPQQLPQPVPPTSGRKSQTVPPTPAQKTRTVPPTPVQKAQTVPPSPTQKAQTMPPTPAQRAQTVPPSPTQKAQAMPPGILAERSKTAPGTPPGRSKVVPPTPAQKAQSIPPSSPQHKPQAVPPTQAQPQPIPSQPTPPTSQQPVNTVPPTAPEPQNIPIPPTPHPQPHNIPIPPTPQQFTKSVPPTPPVPKTMPPTPQQQSMDILSAPQTVPKSNIFDDFTAKIDGSGDGPQLELKDFGRAGASSSQQQQEGDLLGLGADGEAEAIEQRNKSPEGEGGDGGENNNGTKDVGQAELAQQPEGERHGEIQQDDPQANISSPASSGDIPITDVPSDIKERNKQAIITRAQIYDMTKRIKELKEEKTRAQGREELDPLSEESVLMEQEIQKAERSLGKLKKRAEKRYQAAVTSTNLSIGINPLAVNLEDMAAEDAAARLEDIIGLLFGPERKNFKLEITLAKGGPAKAVKAALQKVLFEYGIKSFSKISGLNASAAAKTYTDLIMAFRQYHTKEDDS